MVRIRVVRSITATLVLTGSIVAGSHGEDDGAGLRGPVMGFVVDASQQVIRPVNGIPGSSLLGEPLALPFSAGTAAFSPNGDFALAISAAEHRSPYVLRNLRGTPAVQLIESGINGIDRVLLNADASAGVLLASDARQFQVVRGLPAAPAAGPIADFSSITGTITAVAIDKAGFNVLIGAASQDDGALYVAAADASAPPRLIASFGIPAALTLLNDDRDVGVADAALNEIVLVRDFNGTPEVFGLVTERDGVSGPTGLLSSPDGRRLYIANRGTRMLDVWNLEAQSLESRFTLESEPSRLTPFQGDAALFLLNDAGEHPLLLLEAADTPAVYFVPARGDR